MKQGLARLGGGFAVAVSVLLVCFVTIDSGLNALNAWTVIACAAGGLLAIQMRTASALALIIVGAAPALLGGIAFLYLPALLLVAASLLIPMRTSTSVN